MAGGPLEGREVAMRSREVTDMLAPLTSGVGLRLPCMVGDPSRELTRLTAEQIASPTHLALYRREPSSRARYAPSSSMVVEVMRENAGRIRERAQPASESVSGVASTASTEPTRSSGRKWK